MKKNLIKENYEKKIKLLDYYNQKYFNENISEITDAEFDKLKREIIEVKSVDHKIIQGKNEIGYVRLKSFNENTDKQFFKIIEDMEKKTYPKGYILDVRNNPGGLLSQVINITDFFLKSGEMIVSTKGRRV